MSRSYHSTVNLTCVTSLTTKMDLVKGGDGLYRIAKQTDYYQPEVRSISVLPETGHDGSRTNPHFNIGPWISHHSIHISFG